MHCAIERQTTMLGAPHLSALISSAGVLSTAERAAPREHAARFGRSPGFLLALLFLLVNFAARFEALRRPACQRPSWEWS
jgi:hypothetical protein